MDEEPWRAIGEKQRLTQKAPGPGNAADHAPTIVDHAGSHHNKNCNTTTTIRRLQHSPQTVEKNARASNHPFCPSVWRKLGSHRKMKRMLRLAIIALHFLLSNNHGQSQLLLSNFTTTANPVPVEGGGDHCHNNEPFGFTAARVFREVGPSVVGIWTPIGAGTGIIISKDGLVLTCHHVIQEVHAQGKTMILVFLPDKRIYRASAMGSDPIIDVVVLQLLRDDRNGITDSRNLPTSFSDDNLYLRQFAAIAWFGHDMPSSIGWDDPFPVARFGNSSSLLVGTPVLSLGHTVSYGLEANAGVVSGFYWSNDNVVVRSIMTDAESFSGFSGGPLIDMENGVVVGVNQLGIISVASRKRDILSVGERNVAIPIDEIKDVLPKLMEGKQVTHGTIGVHLLGITKDIPRGSLTSGAEIIKIDAWSPAWWLRKLRRGDVIVEIEGEQVDNAVDARRLIDQAPVGEKLKITVMRNQRKKIIVTVVPDVLKKAKTSSNPLLNLWNKFRKYMWANYEH